MAESVQWVIIVSMVSISINVSTVAMHRNQEHDRYLYMGCWTWNPCILQNGRLCKKNL